MRYPLFAEHNSYYGMGPFDGGICIDSKENELPDNKSPDLLNVMISNGILKKRDGQKRLFSDGDGEVQTCLPEAFYGNLIFLSDGTIKAYGLSSGTVTVLKRNVAGEAGSFFSYNGRVYYIGGGNYLRISQTEGELSAETVEGYVPTVYINCDKNGTGDPDEEHNLLTGKYRASFNTEPDMSYAVIPGDPVDAGAGIEVEYNGAPVSPSRYSLEGGNTVRFSGVSFSEGHNSLVITATAANAAGDREKITYCRKAAFFGGSSSGLSEGTRVFVSGNGEYANTFFRSALKNPEYFPLSGFDILGDTLDPITGFGKQNGSLVIFKKNSIYVSDYNYSSGEVVFTITNISADRGCDHPETIATADNRLIWFNSRFGVLMLTGTNSRSNLNAAVISGPVNGKTSSRGLLSKEYRGSAAAFVYKNNYYLSAGDFCYVLDFSRGISFENAGERNSWYLFSNVYFTCSARADSDLFYGGKNGSFSYFAKVLYDFEESVPIKARYVTKAVDFNAPAQFKTIKNISFVLRADCNCSVSVAIFDEDGMICAPKTHTINKFSFINFSFGSFTFCDNSFAVVITRKTPRRRVKFFKIAFTNELPLSDMAVSSLTAEYKTERRVKYNGI